MTIARTFGLICIVCLGGCGGSGGGDAVNSGGGASQLSYSELDSRYFDIFAKFDRELSDISAPMNLPSTGSVNYNGVIGFQAQQPDEERLELLGDLSLTADFRTSSMSGNATNFFDEREGQYSGTMRITNGTIFRDAVVEDEYTFVADANATLSNAERTLRIDDADLAGDFYSGSEQFISGDLFGDLVTTDGPTIELDASNTYFVGEAQ